MKVDPARMKAIVASLLDKFTGLGIDGFGKLTDRQIVELYGHSRDKDGRIKVPGGDLGATSEEPSTLENDLMQLNKLCALFKTDEATRAQKEAELRAKYAAKET